MGEESILYYNWKRILLKAKTNRDIVDIVRNLTHYSKKEFVGNSYLLKPHRLLNFKQITTDETIQILQIASTRNWFDYWLYGYRGIMLDFCGVSLAKLKLNRFLTIDYDHRIIHLIHEG